MKTTSVRNMKSHNGNKIPNQFIIETPDGEYFQSYKSIIVLIPVKGKTKLDINYWDYSRTTSKYRNLFLNETKKETQKKIDAGIYELVDLN